MKAQLEYDRADRPLGGHHNEDPENTVTEHDPN